MKTTMKLHRDLKEFLSALNAAEVRYLITGGVAVGAHGHPRYTKDIDVWVDSERGNAERVVQAIDDFGFGSLGIVIDDFCDPARVLQLGYAPNRIDLLTFATGLEFASAWERRIESEIDGVPVNLVSLRDLEANKRATGRLQDVADLRKLGFRVTPEEAAAAALKDNEDT